MNLLVSFGHINVWALDESLSVVRLTMLSDGLAEKPDPKIIASAPPAIEIPLALRSELLSLILSKVATV